MPIQPPIDRKTALLTLVFAVLSVFQPGALEHVASAAMLAMWVRGGRPQGL